MHPDEYDRVAPYSELDREYTESEILLGELAEGGVCNELGAEMRLDEHWLDWTPAQLCHRAAERIRRQV